MKKAEDLDLSKTKLFTPSPRMLAEMSKKAKIVEDVGCIRVVGFAYVEVGNELKLAAIEAEYTLDGERVFFVTKSLEKIPARYYVAWNEEKKD